MTSGSVPSADDLAQSRLTKVFNFLKELNELRNPVIRDMSVYLDVLALDAWPAHPCIESFAGTDPRTKRLVGLPAMLKWSHSFASDVFNSRRARNRPTFLNPG
jgi:hypothetical protein